MLWVGDVPYFYIFFYRFFKLKSDFDNGRTSPESDRVCTKKRMKPRSFQAEIWFTRYYETLADAMPDTGHFHLPACLTIQGVYDKHKEDTVKDKGKPISLSQFRKMWKSSFKNVIIPKVNLKRD